MAGECDEGTRAGNQHGGEAGRRFIAAGNKTQDERTADRIMRSLSPPHAGHTQPSLPPWRSPSHSDFQLRTTRFSPSRPSHAVYLQPSPLAFPGRLSHHAIAALSLSSSTAATSPWVPLLSGLHSPRRALVTPSECLLVLSASHDESLRDSGHLQVRGLSRTVASRMRKKPSSGRLNAESPHVIALSRAYTIAARRIPPSSKSSTLKVERSLCFAYRQSPP